MIKLTLVFGCGAHLTRVLFLTQSCCFDVLLLHVCNSLLYAVGVLGAGLVVAIRGIGPPFVLVITISVIARRFRVEGEIDIAPAGATAIGRRAVRDVAVEKDHIARLRLHYPGN